MSASVPASGMSDEATERVARLFEALPRLVANEPRLVRRGRFLTCDFELGIGAQPLAVRVVQGAVEKVERGPFLLRPLVFAVRMGAGDWLGFLQPAPRPGWHDLMALTKSGSARIEGNLQPLLANLQYIKDVLALPRTLTKEAGS